MRALALAAALAACGVFSAPTPINLAPDASILEQAAHPNRPRFGVNVRHVDEEAALRLMREAGLEIVRTDLFWSEVEHDGRYNFSEYDRALERLDRFGLKPLVILDYLHHDHIEGRLDSAEEIAAFARFAGIAAAHYRGRGVTWEIWNEPDVDESDHFVSADVFARMVRQAERAIHSADPGASVVSGGISWIDLDYANAMLHNWDLEGAPQIIGFGAHPYRDEAPETALEDLAGLARAINAQPTHWPLWNTEWGYSAHGRLSGAGSNGHSAAARALQGAYAVRTMLVAWLAGADASVWYEIRDEGQNGRDDGDNFGLLDSAGAPKPAFVMTATLLRLTRDMRLIGALDHLPHGARAVKFESAERTLIAVWIDQPNQRLAISPDRRAGLEAINAQGAAIASSNEPIMLRESDGPFYLSWPR